MDVVVIGAGTGGLSFAGGTRVKAPGARVTLFERGRSRPGQAAPARRPGAARPSLKPCRQLG